MAGFGAQDAKPNQNVRTNSADPLRYEVSASARFMVADQPGRVPNKAETCAVLHKTLHGRETRAIRAKRQQALAELKLLERMGKGCGFM